MPDRQWHTNLLVLAAITLQSHQHFEMTLKGKY